MVAKIKAFWALLPHPIQAAIVGTLTAFVGAIVNVWQAGGSLTLLSLKHYAGSALVTGITSVYIFYMKPGGTVPALPPSPVPLQSASVVSVTERK